jgi:hypothetical protein
VFPARYEHRLHIKSKVMPVRVSGGPEVFPVRYEYHRHIKSKTIPVTGRGGLLGCGVLRVPHCLDNRLMHGGCRPNMPAARLPEKLFFLVLISVEAGRDLKIESPRTDQ